jgi:hypothetical protein
LVFNLTKEQIDLEVINSLRLILIPDVSLSLELNKKNAEKETSRLLHVMEQEEVYFMMHRMHECSAALSLLLSHKDRLKIESDLNDRRAKQFDDAMRVRAEKPKVAKVKVEKVKVSEEEKSIQGFMAMLNISREAAEAIVNKAKASKQAQ